MAKKIDKELDVQAEIAPVVEKQEYQPMYRVISRDSKIPVSKATGALWKARRDSGLSARKNNNVEAAWDEAVKYFRNDQLNHRYQRTTSNTAGNSIVGKRLNPNFTETENVVFSNSTTLVPILFSKNPVCTVISQSEKFDKISQISRKLINTLLEREQAPGLGFCAKAERGILATTLTNSVWMMVGYTFRDQSSEQAIVELTKLSEELENAKDVAELQEVEGKIKALEETLDMLRPSGPLLRLLSPKRVVKDSDSVEHDLSDCNWLMYWDMLSTTYIRAKFMKKTDNGKYESLYAPTHVLKTGISPINGVEDEVNNFQLINKDADYKKLGYDDETAYNRSQYTKVWFVFDKTTRRIFLFHDDNWEWPLWVWDDLYKVDTFFPFFELHFHDDPDGGYAKGEVSYYLDQQDAINEMLSEERSARQWVKRNVLYDKDSIDRKDVEAVLKGEDGTARGVGVPEGKKLADCIFSFAPPAVQFPQLFDPTRKYAAISRISSVSDVLSGQQFKTNTTNQAVDVYKGAAQIKTDSKVDRIEKWTGRIAWCVLQLCLQNMPPEQVSDILGEDVSGVWTPMSPQEIQRYIMFKVVGGSTQKPTTENMKQDALRIAQVLGQFSSATPAAFVVALKVLSRAFVSMPITDSDWQFIMDSVQQQLQRGNSSAQGEQPGAGGGDVEAALAQLPPSVQAAVKDAIAQGVPPEEAIKEAQTQLNQTNRGENNG